LAVIESTRFGRIEVDSELLFTFPRGLPGFEHARSFVVVERDDQAFKWLQSAEDAALAFVLADPHYFVPDYNAEIPQGELRHLRLRFPEDLAMAVVMNVPPSRPEDMTVNLRAPLLFNIRERLGLQIILTSSHHPVDYAVIREWRRASAQLAEQVGEAKARSSAVA